jgi:cytochrome c oxidase accessory protein FixG
MFDRDTLIISYDETRGEPRGGRSRKVDPAAVGLGACIDCNMCVQVCPTGIDIREGLQYECIACAACIDACDSVMDKMAYPRGLIRYTSENAMQRGQGVRLTRPRVVIYGVLLLVLVTVFFWSVGSRTPLRMDAMRDRNSLYREVGAGLVENVYTLKITNLEDTPRAYRLDITGLPEATLQIDGLERPLAPGELRRVPVTVSVPRASLEQSAADVLFRLEAEGAPGISAEAKTRFLGPPPGL